MKLSTGVAVVIIVIVLIVVVAIGWKSLASKGRPATASGEGIGPQGVQQMMQQGGQFTGQGSGAPGGAGAGGQGQ